MVEVRGMVAAVMNLVRCSTTRTESWPAGVWACKTHDKVSKRAVSPDRQTPALAARSPRSKYDHSFVSPELERHGNCMSMELIQAWSHIYQSVPFRHFCDAFQPVSTSPPRNILRSKSATHRRITMPNPKILQIHCTPGHHKSFEKRSAAILPGTRQDYASSDARSGGLW